MVHFTVSQTVESQMVGRLQKDELEMIWREAIAQSKVLLWQLLGGIEEYHKILFEVSVLVCVRAKI